MRFPPQVHPDEVMGVFPMTNSLWACGEWHPQSMKQVNEKASEDRTA